MRRFFIAVLLTAGIVVSAFAEPVTVEKNILDQFKIDFTKALNVSWTVTSDYSKASFTLDGKKADAFYDYKGELIGQSKEISLNELPLNAKRIFAKRYNNYTVTEAIKFDCGANSGYYISAEDEKASLILKVGSEDQVSTFQITKKQ